MDEKEDVKVFNALYDLYHVKFNKNTEVTINSTDSDFFFDSELTDREHITRINIEKSFLYTSALSGTLLLRKIQNGKYSIVFCTVGVRDVVIPDEVGVICSEAFANTDVRNVKIPEGVYEIDPLAFANCPMEEVTLPSSVWDIGRESLSSVKLVHVSKPITYLTCALAGKREGDSANFCVEYKGRYHIIPRALDYKNYMKSDKIIFDESYEPGIHTHFDLARYNAERQESAFEVMEKIHDEEAVTILKPCVPNFLAHTVSIGEECLVRALTAFHREGILPPSVAKNVFDMIADTDWLQAKSCVLNMLDTKSPEASFEL